MDTIRKKDINEKEEEDKENEINKSTHSVFDSLRGILGKPKGISLRSPSVGNNSIHESGDDLMNDYDQIVMEQTMKSGKKSVLPSFLKHRRNSWHRDQAVSNGMQSIIYIMYICCCV